MEPNYEHCDIVSSGGFNLAQALSTGSNTKGCSSASGSGSAQLGFPDLQMVPSDGEESDNQKSGRDALWRVIRNPAKVIEAFYSEGNFYHDIYLEELSIRAGTSHKNVRDTLSRLRKKDERAGKYVPPPPRQQYEFTEEQRTLLDAAFKEASQLDADGTRELSKITNLTVKQINNWFCNQRRKADGRSAEKDRKRRQRLREELTRKGLVRASTFSPDVIDLFENEFEKMKHMTDTGERPAKVPYDMLVEKTGMDRKKIRDWFSKRKVRGKRSSESRENDAGDAWKTIIDTAICELQNLKESYNESSGNLQGNEDLSESKSREKDQVVI